MSINTAITKSDLDFLADLSLRLSSSDLSMEARPIAIPLTRSLHRFLAALSSGKESSTNSMQSILEFFIGTQQYSTTCAGADNIRRLVEELITLSQRFEEAGLNGLEPRSSTTQFKASGQT